MAFAFEATTAAEELPLHDPVLFARLLEVVPGGWRTHHAAVDAAVDAAAFVVQADGAMSRPLPKNGMLGQAVARVTGMVQSVDAAQAQLLSPWLEQQADAIFLFQRAAHATDFNDPVDGNERHFSMVCINLAKVVVVSARLHAFRYEAVQAWRDAGDLLHFAEMFRACLDGYGEQMHGTILQATALRLMTRLAVDCYEPSAIVAQLARLGPDRVIDLGRIVRQFVVRPYNLWSIAALPESGAEWGRKLNAMRMRFEHTLRVFGVAEQPLASMLVGSAMEIPMIASHAQVCDRLATVRMQVSWAESVTAVSQDNWVHMRQILDGPCGHEFEQLAGTAIATLLQPWYQPEGGSPEQERMLMDLDRLLNQSDNAMGVLISVTMARQVTAQISLAIDLEAMRRLTRMALAAALVSKGQGILPVDGQALAIPGVFQAIPEDPYDGRPLRYDATKRLAWSVGQDLNDDGGNPRRDICFALSPEPAVWLASSMFSTPRR